MSGVPLPLRAAPGVSCCGNLQMMPQVATQCSGDRNGPGYRSHCWMPALHPVPYRCRGREQRSHLSRHLPLPVGVLRYLLYRWSKEQRCSSAAFQGTWRKLEACSTSALTKLDGGVTSVSDRGTEALVPQDTEGTEDIDAGDACARKAPKH
ncbi:UNVERIFIED_CONTAM: hypothetical protein FKN15_057103 [Acipenser sinensis]